jgi:hypothetical protein
VRQECR